MEPIQDDGTKGCLLAYCGLVMEYISQSLVNRRQGVLKGFVFVVQPHSRTQREVVYL